MGKRKTIEACLKASNPIQLALVRAHLESKVFQWDRDLTPQEGRIAKNALKAFDRGDYANEGIARYMDPEAMRKIYGR